MKKLGLLLMVLIFVIGGLGVGYATWSETLTISGEVATGDIDPVFVGADSNDACGFSSNDPTGCGTWDFSSTVTWDGTRRDKDVGCTTASVNSQDPTLLGICITNAYPCYYGNAWFEIENQGSVPVNLVGLKLVEISGPTVGRYWVKDIDLVSCNWYYVRLSDGYVSPPNTPFTDYDFALHVSNLGPLPIQLDPVEGDLPDTEMFGDLCFHLGQGAEQDADYDFTVELIFNNWPN